MLHSKLLISRIDFLPYVQTTDVGNDEKLLHPHILNAQLLDIMPVLGGVFFTDLLNNADDDKYKKLLNGGTYTINNKDVIFTGLKAAIVWYAIARKRSNANAIDTGFGLVIKTSEFSTPVPSKQIDSMVQAAQSAGYAYMKEVIDFLNVSKDTYPLWIVECNKETKMRKSQRMKPISRLDD
jgi:hypothetical protein